MALFNRSTHFISRHPLGLLRVLHFMWVSSLRTTRPYHDNPFCIRTELICVILAIPLMVSFVILSFLVFPWLHLDILISVLCKRCFSFFRSAQHSLPSIISVHWIVQFASHLHMYLFSIITPENCQWIRISSWYKNGHTLAGRTVHISNKATST